MQVRRFAGVIAFHEGHMVLVRERYVAWDGEYWNIPSGMVESHETPVLGAVRELVEETGLVVRPDDLRLVGTSETAHDGSRSLAWNFRVSVAHPGLRVGDPDGHVQEARWFPRAEAVDLLRRLPYRPIAEPVTAHLLNTVGDGAHWRYAAPDADPVVRDPDAPVDRAQRF